MKNFIYTLCILVFITFLIGCGKEDTKQHFDKVKSSSGKITKRSRIANSKNEVYEQFSGVEVFPDINKILRRGTLNVGVYNDTSVPFVIKTPKGEIIGGLDIEITNFLAKHLGVKAVFDSNIKSRAELFKKLHKGEIDIAVGELSHTFDRAKYVYFSDAYVQLHQSLICCKQELIDLNIRDNPYKYLSENACKIGVRADTSYVEFAQNLFPKADVYEYPTIQDALDSLNKHEIIAILDDDNEIALQARKYPEIALSATVYVLKNQKDNIAIAVSPKNPNLLDSINLYLKSHDLYFDINDLIEKYPEAYKCE